MFGAKLGIMDLVITACVFGIVLGVWAVVILGWLTRRTGRAEKVQRRLGLGAGTEDTRTLRLWHDGKEMTTEVPGVQTKPSIGERLDRLGREAELQIPIQSIILGLTGIAALLFVLLLLLMGTPLPGLAVGIALLVGFVMWLKGRTARRLARFEVQLVDGLDLAARSLRAGHPLMGSFRLISEEVPPPVGLVFGEICQEQELGLSVDEALRSASEKSPNADMKLFATSVIIQMRTGGNLADMMERISFVIRDRMRLNRRVRVLTAQTQFSKRILVALPFVMFLILNIISPSYMLPFYYTLEGQLLLAIAGGGVLSGMWLMNRLSILKY